MNLNCIGLLALVAMPTCMAQAGVASTCEEQLPCVDWSISKLDSSTCGLGGDCTVEVCMIVDASREGCTKSPTSDEPDQPGTFNHMCDQTAASGCPRWNDAFSFPHPIVPAMSGGETEGSCISDTGDSHTGQVSGKCEGFSYIDMCQEGVPGQTLYWILKDGNDRTVETLKEYVFTYEDGCDANYSCVNDRERCAGGASQQLMERTWTFTIPVSTGGGSCDICDFVNPSVDSPVDTSVNPSVDSPVDTSVDSPVDTSVDLPGTEASVYDPPSEEDCRAIRNGMAIEGQEDLLAKSFAIQFDVTVNDDTDSDLFLDAFVNGAQASVVSDLTSCNDQIQRMLRNVDNSFMHGSRRLTDIANVIANAITTASYSDEGCEVGAQEPCHRIVLNIELFLKGDESIIDLQNMILETLSNDDGTAEGSLIGYFGLTGDADVILVVGIVNLNPMESPAGTLGDPHFKTWKNEHFEYHGQCDMMLTKDPGFADGKGIDVQIRTKLVRFWSYIRNAAIRIGQDILEVEGSVDSEDISMHYWYNLEYQGEIQTLGGFPIIISRPDNFKTEFVIDLSSKYPGTQIVISTYKEFVRVDLKGATEESFGNAVGLLGDFRTGKTLARDGATELNDFWMFGTEWQVLPVEPMLFHDISEPQFPMRCIEPEDPRGERRRRLEENTVSEEQAEAACAKVSNDAADIKDCVYDILATQDLDMAGAY